MTDRHLISEDELRAAGALDVPPEWRKSLSAGCKLPREQMLFGDDDLYPEAQEPTAAVADESEASAEVEDETGDDEAADDEEFDDAD